MVALCPMWFHPVEQGTMDTEQPCIFALYHCMGMLVGHSLSSDTPHGRCIERELQRTWWLFP